MSIVYNQKKLLFLQFMCRPYKKVAISSYNTFELHLKYEKNVESNITKHIFCRIMFCYIKV